MIVSRKPLPEPGTVRYRQRFALFPTRISVDSGYTPLWDGGKLMENVVWLEFYCVKQRFVYSDACSYGWRNIKRFRMKAEEPEGTA